MENEPSNNNPERDEDGNIIFSKNKFDYWADRTWGVTYIFQEWNDNLKTYRPIISIINTEELLSNQEQLIKQNILTLNLFPWKEKPCDKDFEQNSWQRYCCYFYFKEVLHYEFFKGDSFADFDIKTLVLRKSTFDEIENLIASNSLQKVRDIIFYLIAKIQNTYIEEIAYYDTPIMIKRANNAEKEAKKLISVIERIAPDKYIDKHILPTIQNISFVFPDIKPIKIEDSWLNETIVGSIKEHFNNNAFKNWRKDLINYAKGFEEDKRKQKFRFHIAITLHNFFSDQNLFSTSKNNSASSLELLCIAKILELGSIKIGEDEEISEADKIKNVRNYINPKRNILEEIPTHLYANIDIEYLSKYFDKDFLNCVSLTKTMETISSAGYISVRFDLDKSLHEISHLIDCIKHRKNQIGWQFTLHKQRHQGYTVIDPFFNLIDGIAENKNKLEVINFKFENDNKSQIINNRLPLLLIEKAIAEYYNNHKEEFDIDIVKTEIEDNLETKSYSITHLNEFQEQQNRFIVKLCHSLYRYLITEHPPENNIINATKYYSLIIAIILDKSYIFNNPYQNESFKQNKVIQWLQDFKS